MQITSVHVNPVDCNLLLTASNDWEVKLCDLRMLHSISNAAGTAAGPKSKLIFQELQSWQAAQCLLSLSPSSAHKCACSHAGQDVPEHVLASVKHPRLVNAAYFSPNTGRKIATTATDNRIRVWVSMPSCRHLHSQQCLSWLFTWPDWCTSPASCLTGMLSNTIVSLLDPWPSASRLGAIRMHVLHCI